MASIHSLVRSIIEADNLALPAQKPAGTAIRKPTMGLGAKKPAAYGSKFLQTELTRIVPALTKVSQGLSQYPGVSGMDPKNKVLLKQASDRLAWAVGKLGA